jgi:hypothetical protein
MNLVAKQTDKKEVWNHIRVKLHPNYLPQVEGNYVARTDKVACLNISDICAALKNRAGYSKVEQNEMAEYVSKFLEEAVYQLCNGYRINLGFFSVFPNIGGTFESERDTLDPEKNPLSFRFRMEKPLRNLIKHIAIDIDGPAGERAFIKHFVDKDTHSKDSLYAPGNLFNIIGKKIKIAGDSDDCGVYFVPVDEPAKAVKVERLAINHPSMIAGVIPEVGNQQARIEIRTQYSGSNIILLKTPRIITSKFIIQKAS